MSCAGIPISQLPNFYAFSGNERVAIAGDGITYSSNLSSLRPYFKTTDLMGLSGFWQSTYELVENRVLYWDNIFKYPTWDNTTTVVGANSAYWSMAYTLVSDLSADWNDDIGGTVQAVDNNTYNIQARNDGEIGGNPRGDHSIDLQTLRDNPDQVASGLNSVIAGGGNNTASGDFSFVVGKHGSAIHDGSTVFADSTTTPFSSIADNTFNIQADGLRLDDGNTGEGKVLVSDSDGTGTWRDTVGDLNVDGQLDVYGNILSAGQELSEVIATTEEVVSDVTIGGIDPLDVISVGTNLQTLVTRLLKRTYFPTFVNPSVNLYDSLNTNVESGSVGITFTASFNAGAINGDLNGGIWDPNLKQADRAGSVTKYTFEGIDNGTNNVLTVPTIVIQDGANVFDVIVDYNTGPQPKDSINNNYNSPLPAGSVSDTSTVYGVRKAFYGVDGSVTNSSGIRSLGSYLLNPSNGSSFTINIPPGTTSVSFAYPATLRDVSQVEYVEGLSADVKSVFTKTTVNVEGANGYSAIAYKVYTYTPINPYSSEVNYIVTI